MSIKRILFVAALFALTALLITCDDNDEITPRPYPSVKTYPVDGITSTSVTFGGEIVTLGDGVLDHGFIVSRDRSFALILAKISLGSTTQTGRFEATMDESMEEGVTYYARAYADSKSHQILGHVVEFKSLGSKAPELLSIWPTNGTWGDKITLKGKQFGAPAGKVIVRFGEIPAQIEKATKDSIVCLVPADLHHAPSDVSVSVFGNVSKLTEAFQLAKPIITSISPAKGFYGATAVIKGAFFRTPKSDVFFGNVQATVTKTTATEIECIVPATAELGVVTVTVEAGTGNLFAETTFEFAKPVILDFNPKTATYRNTVIITGESINPEGTTTSVKFGDSFAPIVSRTSTQIEVTVPDYLTSITSVVTVTTEGGQTVFNTPFTLLPMEITSVEPTEKLITDLTAIQINGKNFGYTGNQITVGGVSMTSQFEEPSRVLLQPYSGLFNTHDLDVSLTISGQTATVENAFYAEWVQPTVLNSSEFGDYQRTMVFNNELYVLTNQFGTVVTSKLNQANNAWEQVVADGPQLDAYDPFTFSMSGTGYIGGGLYVAIEPRFDFYAFDQSTNQWTRLNDLPFKSELPVGFALGSKGYATTAEGQLWRYNSAADSWTRLNDIPSNLIPYKGFMRNNSFYGVTQSNILVTYNEGTDTWLEVKQFPQYPHTFLFELDGRLYFRYGDVLFLGPIVSFDFDALDEKEHIMPPGFVNHSFSLSDKAFVIIYQQWQQTNLWWEYKPYQD
jgi:hypothetical protein